MVVLHVVFNELPCYVIAIRGTTVYKVLEEASSILKMISSELMTLCGECCRRNMESPYKQLIDANGNYIIICLNTECISPRQFYETLRKHESPPAIILLTPEEYLAEKLGVPINIVRDVMYKWWYKQKYG